LHDHVRSRVFNAFGATLTSVDVRLGPQSALQRTLIWSPSLFAICKCPSQLSVDLGAANFRKALRRFPACTAPMVAYLREAKGFAHNAFKIDHGHIAG
jgi:hypothetical protein